MLACPGKACFTVVRKYVDVKAKGKVCNQGFVLLQENYRLELTAKPNEQEAEDCWVKQISTGKKYVLRSGFQPIDL